MVWPLKWSPRVFGGVASGGSNNSSKSLLLVQHPRQSPIRGIRTRESAVVFRGISTEQCLGFLDAFLS